MVEGRGRQFNDQLKLKGAKDHMVREQVLEKNEKERKKHIKKAKATTTHSGKASISLSRERKKNKPATYLSFGHNGMGTCQFQYSTIYCGVVVQFTYYLTEKNINLLPFWVESTSKNGVPEILNMMVEGKTWRIHKRNVMVDDLITKLVV